MFLVLISDFSLSILAQIPSFSAIKVSYLSLVFKICVQRIDMYIRHGQVCLYCIDLNFKLYLFTLHLNFLCIVMLLNLFNLHQFYLDHLFISKLMAIHCPWWDQRIIKRWIKTFASESNSEKRIKIVFGNNIIRATTKTEK